MTEDELTRIKDAWSDASDLDVARALEHPEDYSDHVMSLIREEADRRQLGEAERAELVALRSNDPIHLLGRTITRFLRSHVLLSASVYGIAVAVLLLYVGPPSSLQGAIVRMIGSAVLLYLCLGWLCWPLRNYRPVILASVAYALAGTVFSVVLAGIGFWGSVGWSPEYLAMLGFGTSVKWAVACFPLCGVVYLRNRYRPVYAPGHCRQCGYNLTGLPEARCPECGTPFDPATAGPASISEETP